MAQIACGLVPLARFSPKKLRSPLKVNGGKYYLGRRIIVRLPRRQNHVEPFAGGFNVGLNLVPSDWDRRVYNDLNPKLACVFLALRDHPGEFIATLREISYSQESFDLAKARDETRDPATIDPITASLEVGVDYFVRTRMSRGGLGQDFAWSDRLRGGQPGDVNAWNTMVQGRNGLMRISEVLRGVEIFNRDGVELFEEVSKDASIVAYLDPTYMHATRTARTTYGMYEMTDVQHERIARRGMTPSMPATAMTRYSGRMAMIFFRVRMERTLLTIRASSST